MAVFTWQYSQGSVHREVFTAAAIVFKFLLPRGHALLLRALEINNFPIIAIMFAFELKQQLRH
jgi:hypothetical protein